MNEELNKRKIRFFVRMALRAYTIFPNRMLNFEACVEWIYNMLEEFGETSVYTDKNVILYSTQDSYHYGTLLEAAITQHHPYHNYLRQLVQEKNLDSDKIQFIYYLSLRIVEDQEILDQTDSDFDSDVDPTVHFEVEE